MSDWRILSNLIQWMFRVNLVRIESLTLKIQLYKFNRAESKLAECFRHCRRRSVFQPPYIPWGGGVGEQLPYENYRGICHTFQGWGVQPQKFHSVNFCSSFFIGCIKTKIEWQGIMCCFKNSVTSRWKLFYATPTKQVPWYLLGVTAITPPSFYYRSLPRA